MASRKKPRIDLQTDRSRSGTVLEHGLEDELLKFQAEIADIKTAPPIRSDANNAAILKARLLSPPSAASVQQAQVAVERLCTACAGNSVQQGPTTVVPLDTAAVKGQVLLQLLEQLAESQQNAAKKQLLSAAVTFNSVAVAINTMLGNLEAEQQEALKSASTAIDVPQAVDPQNNNPKTTVKATTSAPSPLPSGNQIVDNKEEGESSDMDLEPGELDNPIPPPQPAAEPNPTVPSAAAVPPHLPVDTNNTIPTSAPTAAPSHAWDPNTWQEQYPHDGTIAGAATGYDTAAVYWNQYYGYTTGTADGMVNGTAVGYYQYDGTQPVMVGTGYATTAAAPTPPLPLEDQQPPQEQPPLPSETTVKKQNSKPSKPTTTTTKTTSKSSSGSKKEKKLLAGKFSAAMMSQWNTRKKELADTGDHSTDEDDDNDLDGVARAEALERKKALQVEEWRLSQLHDGGATANNPNFAPLGGSGGGGINKKSKFASVSNGHHNEQHTQPGLTKEEQEPVVEEQKQQQQQTQQQQQDIIVAVGSDEVPDLSQFSVGLPSGWQAMWDAGNAAIYYGNLQTKETQWERPT